LHGTWFKPLLIPTFSSERRRSKTILKQLGLLPLLFKERAGVRFVAWGAVYTTPHPSLLL
jgi:hypothetical protein